MAISVGSVEVDVIPSTRGIYQRLRQGMEPAASRVGDEIGRVIGRYIQAGITGAVRDGITAGGRQAQAPAVRQGTQTGSAFARSFKTRLEAALRDLPEVRLNANSTDAEREIAQIRAQMQSLRDVRIGIDVSEADAVAAMDHLRERLDRLSASDANVAIRVDAGAASAQLAAFQGELNRLDGQTADVDVDTHAATANLNALTTAAIAFGPALIPVLPVVAAGLGAVAAAAAAAGAGIGGIALVAVPAFKQIAGVLQAQKAAQDAAATATAKGGQAAAQASSRALQLAGAQQAVATAERNGARQIAQAEQQVTQARQNAAQVAQQAALQSQQAARAVADAERALSDAQKAAAQAQRDLTAARQQAAQELEDLNNRLTDSQLSQRDAEIQLKEATAQRDAVLKNANATELDKQKALLAYDQAVQRLKEQTTQTQRLKTETDAANKAGVKGSQTYKNAQDQLAQAQQQVADKQRALKDAQAEQARVAQQNAQQIAAAQQRIADAQANVANAQQQAADQMASAQRQLQQAQLSAAGGADAAATAQAKYEQQLAKLSPAARATFNAFVNLRSAFSAWSRSLQPAVMPIFTRALVGLRNVLPTLTPFVLAAADAVKGLQDRFSRQVKTPFWQGFKKDLQTSVQPAITGLGVAFGNVIKGMAGLVDAFLPHMDGISGHLQRITGRFANWAAGLKGSPEFESFLSYASEHGPVLARVLGQIFTAFLNVSKALSPIGDIILPLLGGLADAIGIIADKAPWFIQLIYGIILATKLWTLAQIAFNFVMSANPLVLIGLAILALVGFVIYAYNKWGWFRIAVQAAWDGIKTAALFVWNNVLKPVFSALVLAVQTAGRWAMWLWTNAIKPAWDAISLAARILLTAIVVIAIVPIILAIKALGAIGSWLWTHVFRPVFQWIGDKAKWLWENAIKPAWDGIKAGAKTMWEVILKPIFKAFWSGLQTVGGWAKWLWQKAIKPAWDGIVLAGKWAWEHGIKPVFDGWKKIIHGLGGVFEDAVKAIKTAWDKIKDVAKKPVQFIVDTVYNNGIVGVWNKVASAFGAPKLKTFKFATGGVLPGYTPGRDVHLAALSGGEAVMRPEWTRAVGPGYVNAMNAAARAGGVTGVQRAMTLPAFKDGGIFDWVGSAASALKGVGSKAWNTVKKGASWLKDTLEASARAGMKHVVDPLLKRIPGLDTGFGKLVRHIPDSIVDAIFGYSKKADDKGAGGGGAIGGVIPKGKRLSIINQALAAAHVPPPGVLAQWQAGLNTLITRESGWNPRAINRWDSNAKAGHPSQGLAQTIPGTFNHYVPAALRSRGILDPVANVAAAIRYIVATYGNITRVQQANANRPPAGYDSGGWMPPGMNLMYNGLGKPEAVLTPNQWRAIQGAAVRGSDGPQQPVVVEVHAKEGTLGDFIDVRVQEHQQQLIQVINAS